MADVKKQERDFTPEVDKLIPESESLVKVGIFQNYIGCMLDAYRFPYAAVILAYPKEIRSLKQVEKLPFIGAKLTGLVRAVLIIAFSRYHDIWGYARSRSLSTREKLLKHVSTLLFIIIALPIYMCRDHSVFNALPSTLPLQLCIRHRTHDRKKTV